MFQVPRGEFAPPRGRPIKYPIRYLNIGESLFFPGVTHSMIKSTIEKHKAWGLYYTKTICVSDGIEGMRVTRIEKNGPRIRGKKPRFPLRSLAIGESLFAPCYTASQAHHLWQENKTMKFKARTVVKDGITGARIWRIA